MLTKGNACLKTDEDACIFDSMSLMVGHALLCLVSKIRHNLFLIINHPDFVIQ